MSTFSNKHILKIKSRLESRLCNGVEHNYPITIRNTYQSGTEEFIVAFSWDTDFMKVPCSKVVSLSLSDNRKQLYSKKEIEKTLYRVEEGLILIWTYSKFGSIQIDLRRARRKRNEHVVEINLSHFTYHPRN